MPTSMALARTNRLDTRTSRMAVVLPRSNLTLHERLEGRKSFRLVEASSLDVSKDGADVEKRLRKVLSQRLYLRERRVKCSDRLLQIFRVLGSANRGPSAPRKRRLSRACSSFGGVLGGVSGSPRSGSTEAELALGGRAGVFRSTRFPVAARRGPRRSACLAPFGWLRQGGFLRLGHIALGWGKIRRPTASHLIAPSAALETCLGSSGEASRANYQSWCVRVYTGNVPRVPALSM